MSVPRKTLDRPVVLVGWRLWLEPKLTKTGLQQDEIAAVVPILSVVDCCNLPTAATPVSQAHDYLLLVFPRLRRLQSPFPCLLPTSESAPTVAEVAVNLGWWAEVCTQLLAAVKGLHAANVAHCDIKPSNLLLDPVRGRLLLSDLGLARVDASHAWIPRGTGTMDWCPDEIVKGKGGLPKPVDVFAVGLVMCKLMRHVLQGYWFRDTIYRHLERVSAARVAHLLCSVVRTLPAASLGLHVSDAAATGGSVPAETTWLHELEHLLCAMMAADPANRPVIGEAQARFELVCGGLRQAYPTSPVSLKIDVSTVLEST